MVSFVDDIFLSEVCISEVFWPLFVSCVLLCVYELLQMLNLNTIHSRNSEMHLIFHFFLICAFYARHPKTFPVCLLTPNELMVDLPDDPSVTIAKMEASILDFLMFSSEIVASISSIVTDGSSGGSTIISVGGNSQDGNAFVGRAEKAQIKKK